MSPSIDPNFVDVTRLLNKNAVPYFIGFGTLLRLYRDGQLSQGTGDIDVCLRPMSMSIVEGIDMLKSLGFVVGGQKTNVQGHREGGRKVDLNFLSQGYRQTPAGEWKLFDTMTWTVLHETSMRYRMHHHASRLSKAIAGDGEINRPLYRQMARGLRLTAPITRTAILSLNSKLGGNLPHKIVEYRIPSDALDTELVFRDGISWYQPRQVEAVLEALYGSEWSIPMEGDRWHSFTREVG